MSRCAIFSRAYLVIATVFVFWLVSPGSAVAQLSDQPPDLTPYARAGVPEDLLPEGRSPLVVSDSLPPGIVLFLPVDLVVNNTNPFLQFVDRFGDSEPSIAVNPADPTKIVVLAFSGNWGTPANPTNAPLWYSTNGGRTWTKEFNIPPPTGIAINGCPCDQTPDYTRDGTLEATFLNANRNVYSGDTVNPNNPIAWNWWMVGGIAQTTNLGVGATDQPWLLVNRDNNVAAQDNDYVAYDRGLQTRVSVALGPNLNPPMFTRDNQAGVVAAGNINQGLRLGVDPRAVNGGAVYSLFQSATGPPAGGAVPLQYIINRSQDGGVTWPLQASANGCDNPPRGNGGPCILTPATSTQGCRFVGVVGGALRCLAPNTFKFGTVNALLGGVDHLTVDPDNGDVYVVYGDRDGAGNNLLFVDRLGPNGTGGIKITGGPTRISPVPGQAALPSIAVAVAPAAKWVGVLYDTYDGPDPATGFPVFTVHFTVSNNRGGAFVQLFSLSFLSPAINNGDPRQRLLGDYQQLKAVGDTFYGTFTANGLPFRLFPFIANNDPFFFRVTVGVGP